LGKLFAAQMPIRPIASDKLRDPVIQGVALVMAEDHTDFQPFGRVRLTDGSRSPHWLSFATDKGTVRHR